MSVAFRISNRNKKSVCIYMTGDESDSDQAAFEMLARFFAKKPTVARLRQEYELESKYL